GYVSSTRKMRPPSGSHVHAWPRSSATAQCALLDALNRPRNESWPAVDTPRTTRHAHDVPARYRCPSAGVYPRPAKPERREIVDKGGPWGAAWRTLTVPSRHPAKKKPRVGSPARPRGAAQLFGPSAMIARLTTSMTTVDFCQRCAYARPAVAS